MNLQKHFDNELKNLRPDEFVVPIYSFLRDEGYKVEYGPFEGMDGGVDLLGERPSGQHFYCQIKTTKNKSALKAGFKDSIETAISERKLDTELPLLGEFILASKFRIEQKPIDLEQWKAKIKKIIITIDKRYSESALHIRCLDSSNIANAASVDKNNYFETYQFLLGRINNLLKLDSGIFSTELSDLTRLPHSKIKEIIGNSTHFFNEDQISLICKDIIQIGGEYLLSDVSLATAIRQALSKNALNTFYAKLVFLSTSIALHETLKQEDLEGLMRDAPCPYEVEYEPTFFVFVRFLRALSYQQPSVLDSAEVIDKLKDWAEIDVRWQKYLCDLSYRAALGSIALPATFIDLCKAASISYENDFPTYPLNMVKNFILNPTSLLSESKEFICNLLYNAAKNCVDSIDVKWTISAFNRIINVLLFDDDLEFLEKERKEFIQKFPLKLQNTNRQIIFFYLKNLLFQFQEKVSEEEDTIRLFEQHFVNGKEKLHPLQISYLQCCYASLIHAKILRGENLDFLEASNVWSHLLKNRNLGSTSIFENPHFRTTLNTRISVNKRDIIFFLEKYITSIVSGHINPSIRSAPLSSSQVRFFTNVISVKQSMSDTIQSSIDKLINSNTHMDLVVWCHICYILNPYFRTKTSDKAMFLAKKCLKADKFTIIKSASAIANAIYVSFYYGSKQNRSTCLKLFEDLKQITGIGESKPKLYWAYYAGVNLRSSKDEKDFIHELEMVLSNITPEMVLKNSDNFLPLNITGSAIEIVKKFKHKSLFASVCQEQISAPETWNIIATSLNNISSEDNDQNALKTAGKIYGLCRLLTTGTKLTSEKYCYNYIRTLTKYYNITTATLPDSFISNVVTFLKMPLARQFSYKYEALSEFMNMISTLRNQNNKEAIKAYVFLREARLIKTNIDIIKADRDRNGHH